MMTTLIELEEQTHTGQPEHDQRLETYRRRNRTLTILVVLMAAVLVAMVAWVVFDATRSSDVAPTAEIEQLLDDYRAAWNDYDSDGFLATVTASYTFEFGVGTNDAEEQASVIADLDSWDWNVIRLGEPIMAGDGPWYVAEVNRVTDNDIISTGQEGISVTKVVDDDGTLKVARHVFVGQV